MTSFNTFRIAGSMSTSWVLVVYLSTLTLNAPTGGPLSVQGFADKDSCMETGARFKAEVPKVDWYRCVMADLPPQPPAAAASR